MEKRETLNINLTPQEKQKLLLLASSTGQSVSEYIISKIFSESSDVKSNNLSKYEADLLTNTLNNTILIRYLVDKIGDVTAIEKAKESVKKWIDTNYTNSK